MRSGTELSQFLRIFLPTLETVLMVGQKPSVLGMCFGLGLRLLSSVILLLFFLSHKRVQLMLFLVPRRYSFFHRGCLSL